MASSLLLLSSCLLLLSGPAPPAPALQGPVTERISVSTAGAEANGSSFGGCISADGRLVVFTSHASNLVPGDTNGAQDVFLRDRQAGTTVRLSVPPGGGQADAGSWDPAISPDGRFVVFVSAAGNLVPGDGNGAADVFLLDRLQGTLELVSVTPAGVSGNAESYDPRVTDDGRRVAFASKASDLLPGDTNGQPDVFLRDLPLGQTERISVSTAGVQGNGPSISPAISADGRIVVFTSQADNLVVPDGNGVKDIFLRDRQTATTERISNGLGMAQANATSELPNIAADGRLVVFHSHASNLVPGDVNGQEDIFLFDRSTGTIVMVSRSTLGLPSNGESVKTGISADGWLVVFDDTASNLAADGNGQKDVFVHDRRTGITDWVSVGWQGQEGTDASFYLRTPSPVISGDGRFVVFASLADNLVAGDTNGVLDVFVHDRQTGGATLDLGNLVAGQQATLTVRAATPGARVWIGASTTGQGPTPFSGGLLRLSPPLRTLFLTADATGTASTGVPVPAVLQGRPLWVQGVDLARSYPTELFFAFVR